MKLSETRTRPGFTLAEIVVAVTLFALYVTVLCQAVYYGLQALAAVDSKVDFTPMLALVRQEVLPMETIEALEEGGEVMVGGDTNVTWEAEVFPTTLLDFFVIELRIRFPSEMMDDNEIVESLMVYRPAWSAGFDRDSLKGLKEERFREFITAKGGLGE